MAPQEDWGEVLRRLLASDRVAFAKLSRIVTGTLAGLRAYDFREDWKDLVQDVIWVVIEQERGGKIHSHEALPGFVRTTTTRMFHAHLRKSKRLEYQDDLDAKAPDLHWPPGMEPQAVAGDLWAEVQRLPEKQRLVLEAMYRDGRTQNETSEATGYPLGSVKRYQALGLRAIRKRIAAGAEI